MKDIIAAHISLARASHMDLTDFKGAEEHEKQLKYCEHFCLCQTLKSTPYFIDKSQSWCFNIMLKLRLLVLAMSNYFFP